MAAGLPLYRAIVRLYPREFRQHFGDDLVLHFEDLVARDGASRAWGRTAVDLAVTLPRYRLETIMNPRRSTTALVAVILTLSLAGIVGFGVGFYPALALVVVAGVVAVAERTQLAASLRAANPTTRRHLLWTSAGLAVVCVASLVVGMIDLGGRDDWPAVRVLTYNAVFFTSIIASVVCLVAGLRTPRSSLTRTPNPA